MSAAGAPLLVTMGDALGIGPEIVVRAWAAGELDDAVVVGAPAVVRRALAVCGLDAPLASLASPAHRAATPPGALPVWAPSEPLRGAAGAALAAMPWGRVRAEAGAAAVDCIEAAVRAVRQGAGRALVTAPLHKEALAAAGSPFPGHTEMLQALAATPGQPAPPVRMMLANPELKVVLATVHLALRDAVQAITAPRVLETIRIAHAAAQAWGQPVPRIAVAGLNPHAGEGGLFGREEIEHIAPAIAQARAEGIEAGGPFPPDTVFMRARRGAFDLVVAMTHDHGLIPVKYLGVDDGVNVTLGLPFVRTSPDHGTAFDIAGRGVADAASLIAAARMARRLVPA